MMTRTFTHFSIMLLTSTALLALGCGETNKADVPSPAKVEQGDRDSASTGGHDHDTGPNGGPMAVLGSHEFHVELLADDETGAVRSLLTDSEFKPIETTAKSLSINMVLNGKPRQFTLDYTDNTSPVEFQTTDKALAAAIHDGWEGEARIVIEISGSPRTGALTTSESGHEGEQAHEHDEESEAHGDHSH